MNNRDVEFDDEGRRGVSALLAGLFFGVVIGILAAGPLHDLMVYIDSFGL